MANGQWFKHDSNASRDPRMLRLKRELGREGCHVYWEVIELMRQNENDYGLVIKDLDVLIDDLPELPELVDTMLSLELLYAQDGKVYSARLLRDMDVKDRKSAVRSAAGKAGAEARWHGNRMASDADAMAGNAKKEEKKEEKKAYADNVFLTEAECQKLVDQYGMDQFQAMLKKLDAYKGSNGKKYKSDYKAILTWVVDAIKAVPLPEIRSCPNCRAELSGGVACLHCGWRKDE